MNAKAVSHILSQNDFGELDGQNTWNLETRFCPKESPLAMLTGPPAESDSSPSKNTRVIHDANAFHCNACGKSYSWREVTLAWFGWVCAHCLKEILTSEEMTTSEDYKPMLTTNNT